MNKGLYAWYTYVSNNGGIMEITKESLVENLKKHFMKELTDNLAQANLDEEEVQANIVLSKKRIQADADNITELVFDAMKSDE